MNGINAIAGRSGGFPMPHPGNSRFVFLIGVMGEVHGDSTSLSCVCVIGHMVFFKERVRFECNRKERRASDSSLALGPRAAVIFRKCTHIRIAYTHRFHSSLGIGKKHAMVKPP